MYITFCSSNSFVDGPLGCIHVSAIVNYAAMNIGIQVSVQDPVFNYLGYILTSEIVLWRFKHVLK